MHSRQQQDGVQAQQSQPSDENARPSYNSLDFDRQTTHKGERPPHQRDTSELSPHHRHVQAMLPAQGLADNSRRTLIQVSNGKRDGFEQLDPLAHVLQPEAMHRGYPLPADIIAEPGHSNPNRASDSSNPAPPSIGVDEQSGSYGTLMLSKGGRSKYLGPTAGSEWLKEVCHLDSAALPERKKKKKEREREREISNNNTSRKHKIYQTVHRLLALPLQRYLKLRFPFRLIV